jgi:hypothetical protein
VTCPVRYRGGQAPGWQPERLDRLEGSVASDHAQDAGLIQSGDEGLRSGERADHRTDQYLGRLPQLEFL